MRSKVFPRSLSYTRNAGRLLTAVAVMLVSACSLFAPIENDMRVEVIDKLPTDIPQRQTNAATLLILAPNSNPVYDTVRIAYRNKPHQIEYFGRHEWGATPAQMLLPLLARTMENTGYFNAVVTPPYFGRYRYALRTEILELAQDFTVVPATLHLSVRAQLVDGTSNRIIASRTIAINEPMMQENPYAGVVATNEAAAKTLQQVAGFVLAEMR